MAREIQDILNNAEIFNLVFENTYDPTSDFQATTVKYVTERLTDLNITSKISWQGTWSAGDYSENDLVIHLGGVYIAVTDTSNIPVTVHTVNPDWSEVIKPSFYEYTNVTEVLNIPSTWSSVASIVETDAPAGVYRVGFEASGSLENINDQALIRLRINAGEWIEFRESALVAGDTVNWFYAYTFTQIPGTVTAEIEAMKVAGGGIFDLSYANIIIDKKL